MTAISIHAYAYVSDKYALLPSGASMGDGYGPMLVSKVKYGKAELARKEDRGAGDDDERVLALQLWLWELVEGDRIMWWCRSMRFSRRCGAGWRRWG